MTTLASLVVPVYQSAGYLPRTARSWLDQELDGAFEVLLVDNGSTDGGVDALPAHPRLRRLHEPRRGAYAARNAGVSAAQGEFLVFVDPDCLASPGWLRRLLAPLRGNAAIVAAQGPAWPAGGDRRLQLLGLYEFHREAMVYRSADPKLYYAHTNNLAVRHDAFERCGPFDLRARGADTLLAQRIVGALGCQAMVHAPDAPVEHLEVDSCGVWMRKIYLYGRGRYGHAGPDEARGLNLAERLSVWRATTQGEMLSSWASIELLAMLAVGCGCWWAGCAAGLLRRRASSVQTGRAASWSGPRT
jgi:glycosyltransferase involved in cell wall biosynthesis